MPRWTRSSSSPGPRPYKRLQKQLDKEKDLLADLGPEFLPPSIEVYPEKSLRNFTRLKEFSDFLATLPGVQKVQYGQEWLERLGYFTELLRVIVGLSGTLLVLATGFMVSCTIRLTVVAKESELEILRLVGASNRYIQAPLFFEGILQGLLGSSSGLDSALHHFHLDQDPPGRPGPAQSSRLHLLAPGDHRPDHRRHHPALRLGESAFHPQADAHLSMPMPRLLAATHHPRRLSPSWPTPRRQRRRAPLWKTTSPNNKDELSKSSRP